MKEKKEQDILKEKRKKRKKGRRENTNISFFINTSTQVWFDKGKKKRKVTLIKITRNAGEKQNSGSAT